MRLSINLNHFDMIIKNSERIVQENKQFLRIEVIMKCEFSDSAVCSETKDFWTEQESRGK
jgi:hypothetical protein